ncbi:hypothetical protein CCH79_00011984 [Gambusia affinis]|uniref:Uncharacterized protein n=1 Tax=Gambusia affinis TaxID=33528 RepID=A0A315W9B1_GAMAF|nr:hypothetical protein CCH79_00011984 [Gambusia affinis]
MSELHLSSTCESKPILLRVEGILQESSESEQPKAYYIQVSNSQAFIRIPGPVKATQLCADTAPKALGPLNGLPAGLFMRPGGRYSRSAFMFLHVNETAVDAFAPDLCVHFVRNHQLCGASAPAGLSHLLKSRCQRAEEMVSMFLPERVGGLPYSHLLCRADPRPRKIPREEERTGVSSPTASTMSQSRASTSESSDSGPLNIQETIARETQKLQGILKEVGMLSIERDSLLKAKEELKSQVMNMKKAALEKDKMLEEKDRTLQNLFDVVRTLKEENTTLEKNNNFLKQKNFSQEQKKSSLKWLNKVTNRRVDNLHHDIHVLLDENRDLEHQNEALIETKYALKRENQKVTTLEEEKNTLQKENTALGQKNVTLLQENAIFNQVNTILEEENKFFEEKSNVLDEEKTALEQRNTTLEKEKTALEQESTDLEQKISNLEQKIRTLELNNATLELQSTTLQHRNTNLKLEVKQLNKRLRDTVKQQKQQPSEEETHKDSQSVSDQPQTEPTVVRRLHLVTEQNMDKVLRIFVKETQLVCQSPTDTLTKP